MRIKKVQLNNFKCFSSAEFEFGKLTIFTGANSSGKSSVLAGILAAVQSKDFPLLFTSRVQKKCLLVFFYFNFENYLNCKVRCWMVN